MEITAFLILLGMLFVLLFSGVWVGITLMIVGIVGISIFTFGMPAGSILSSILWTQTNSSSMVCMALFILMGEFLVRSDVASGLFKGLAPLVHKLPGGLLHVNTLASAFFAAVSGSVAATTVTVGKITLPELRQRGYDDEITIGSLACCGTLGILIPPSMPMLIYGFISGTSVGKLFIAGVLPGLILAVLFSGYVVARCLVKPSIAPNRGETYTAKERLAGVPQLLPVVLLILLVLGSIYTGYATPTEAASIGVIGSFLFALLNRKVNWEMIKESLLSTVSTTAMIMLIVMAAAYFSVAIGYIGIPRYLAALVTSSNISPYVVMLLVSIFYLILGCLVDGTSMVVMSVPLVLPMVQAAGFDPLWFGIYLIIMVQIAQVTPPVGFNLFVINGMTGMNMWRIAKSALPFFLLMVAYVIFIIAFPDSVLWLPNRMM